ADGAPLARGRRRAGASRTHRRGLPDPRARGLRRPHARARERARGGRPGLDQAQGRRARRGRGGRRRLDRRRGRRPPPGDRAAHGRLPSARGRRRGRARAPAVRDRARGDIRGARAPHARRGALRRRARALRGPRPRRGRGGGRPRRGRARRPARGAPEQPRRARRRRERRVGRARRGDARAGGAAPVDRVGARAAAADRPGRGAAALGDEVPRRVRGRVLGGLAAAARARRRRAGLLGGDRAWRQRSRGQALRRAAGAAPRPAARLARADRREALVRRPGLRRLHRSRRRPAGELVLLPRRRRGRPRGDDDRGSRGAARVRTARGRVHAARGAPVRLLHAGDAADGVGAPRHRGARERRVDPPGAGRQPLPLHGLPRDPRGGRGARRSRMTTVARPTRSQIGRSHPRLDAREKLRGQAQFAGDLLAPRMLHGRVLRSPIAHGRIVSIDASAAERMAGVVCVLTGEDLRDLDPYYGHAIKDRPIVAIDKVRFHGEPVAAVAAETKAAAAAALDAIAVEYEELPVVGDVEAAVAPDAPLVTDRPVVPGLFHGLGELPGRDGNVSYRYRIDRGELEAVVARADVIVEGEYDFPAVYQYAMEPHTVVAQVEGDEITLWASCQHPFLVRAEIADLFRVPVANVRVIVPFLGGGFGSKSYTKLEPLTVALARKAGRPVRIENRV